jgi:hypothetical protein
MLVFLLVLILMLVLLLMLDLLPLLLLGVPIGDGLLHMRMWRLLLQEM